MAQGLSCSSACGIFWDQGSNLCPLHRQADSYSLHQQGSPLAYNSEDRKYIIYFRKSPIQNRAFFKTDKHSGVRTTHVLILSHLKWALHMTRPFFYLSSVLLSINLGNFSTPFFPLLNPQLNSHPTASKRKQKQ